LTIAAIVMFAMAATILMLIEPLIDYMLLTVNWTAVLICALSAVIIYSFIKKQDV
jgi:predicted membrane protein